MKQTLLFVLTLTGLSSLSAHIIREYHYVGHERVTWADAQKYCRHYFNDLATIENEDESKRLQSVWQGTPIAYAWMGLYNNFKQWSWALGNVKFNNEFSRWSSVQPDQFSSDRRCIVMSEHGFWHDAVCEEKYPAVCYYEQGPARYILVQTKMSWSRAMTYCRSNYTDLVSIRNMSENNQITSLLSEKTWIGLHRRPWAYFSDQTPRTFTIWYPAEPSAETETACALVNRDTTLWSDVVCTKKYPMLCQTLTYHQHNTTFKLKFQSKADLNDHAVQQQILEQLHGKLGKHGAPGYKLHWIQTDGQTFHKEDKKKEKDT